MHLRCAKKCFFRMLWWPLSILIMLASITNIQGQTLHRTRSHKFQGHAFDFSNWRQSSAGFQCPHEQEYVILCKLQWDIISSDLDALRTPGVQCANGGMVTLICIIAIEALTIGAVLFYACKMRKKVRQLTLNAQGKFQSSKTNVRTF